MTRLERLGLEVVAFNLLGSRSQAATLCALIDGAGAAISPEDIVNARQWRGAAAPAEPDVCRGAAKARICLLRESLSDIGLSDLIETHGEGFYSLPTAGRSRVVDRLTLEVA